MRNRTEPTTSLISLNQLFQTLYFQQPVLVKDVLNVWLVQKHEIYVNLCQEMLILYLDVIHSTSITMRPDIVSSSKTSRIITSKEMNLSSTYFVAKISGMKLPVPL